MNKILVWCPQHEFEPWSMFNLKKRKSMKNKACIIILLSSINENTLAKGIEESADRNIQNIILKSYLKVYESYQGLKSKQNVCMKVINPDTDKIVKTEEIEMIREDFFYKKPVVTGQLTKLCV